MDILAGNGDREAEAPFTFDGEPVYVRWAGQGRLCLHNDSVDWREVSHGETDAAVTIYSPAEWKHGPHGALDLLEALMLDLYRRPVQLHPGRLDLCRDMVGVPMSQFDLRQSTLKRLFVTRAVVQSIPGLDGSIETVYVGKGGKEKHLRIYNKTREQQVKPKTHYQPVWDAAEYDPEREGSLTRFEFQTNTAWWSKFVPADEMPAVSMRDQLRLLGHAWAKLTREVRMVVQDGNETHRERLATTLLWQLLQTPFDPAKPHATGDIYRRRAPQREKLLQQIGGCGKSVAALTDGAEFASFGDWWDALGAEVLPLWQAEGSPERLALDRRARIVSSA